jgi:hypothetical protein
MVPFRFRLFRSRLRSLPWPGTDCSHGLEGPCSLVGSVKEMGTWAGLTGLR